MNKAGPTVAGALCGLVIVVPIMLLVGAAILRAAVSLTNKLLGGRSPTDLDYYAAVGGYHHPRYPRAESPEGFLIPQPSTGRAVAILLCAGVVNFVVHFGLMIAVGVSPPGGVAGVNLRAMFPLISLGAGSVAHVAMLSSMLPTSLGRAFAVAVAQFLIAVLVVVVVGGTAVLLLSGLPRR